MMNTTIGIEQLNNVRNEFKAYLREMNPHWSDASVSTASSDAFFALNNNIGVDLWTSMISEESLLTARDLIRDYLAEKGSDRSDEYANAYLSALRQLKAFLDARHPALPAEWSGKAISDVNLKSEFQAWMKKQKKSNGESHSPNTINAYITALKNATAKLRLGDDVNSDLFFYTSLDEFETAQQTILVAPGFEEVDIAAGNKAYSNGMVLYARFLKELGEPSAWIFQGNPKYYDVVTAIEAIDSLAWTVSQYQKQVKKGDKVISGYPVLTAV